MNLVSAHEGGRTEHAVLTRYHGRDCTQREHERVHEHKRTWLYPSDPNDASLRFLSTGGRCGRMCQCQHAQHICHGHAFAVLVVLRRCARRHTCLSRYSQTSMDCSKELQKLQKWLEYCSEGVSGGRWHPNQRRGASVHVVLTPYHSSQ